MKKLLSVMLLATTVLSSCVEYHPRGPAFEPDPVFNPAPLPEEYVEDEFLNEHGKPLDIGFYVDTSCSMIDNQNILWNSIEDITNMLDERNIYYHMSIVGTGSTYEPVSGVFHDHITPHTPGPTGALQTILRTSGNAQEAGLDAIGWGLGPNLEYSENFFRMNTPVHLITISDEVDQSTVYTYGGAKRAIEEFERLKNSHVTWTGVVDPLAADGYASLASSLQNDGRIVNIFDPDWVDIMIEDLDVLATSIKYEYFLRDLPQADTLEVIIYDDGIHFVFSHEDWNYNPIRNSVTFNEFTPEADAIIYVRYLPQN